MLYLVPPRLLLYGHIMYIPQLTSKGQQNIFIGIDGDTANSRNFT